MVAGLFHSAHDARMVKIVGTILVLGCVENDMLATISNDFTGDKEPDS